MAELHIANRVILIAGACVGFFWFLIALVRRARRSGKGVQAVGAMLMLFGWGNLRDPANNPVAEAQDGRIRKGESTGDPPADD
jgi:hypothetical protein